jgi:hypothetical protein
LCIVFGLRLVRETARVLDVGPHAVRGKVHAAIDEPDSPLIGQTVSQALVSAFDTDLF